MTNKLKKILVFTILCTNFAKGQIAIDASNVREGETVEYCTQHKKAQKLMQDPQYVQSLQQDEIIRQKEKLNSPSQKGIYKIPIVFHVLHMNGVENISKEQIMDQLAILNRDFRLQNADANTVQSVFAGMPTDVEIEFVLATKAPDGKCFSGITRTNSALSYQGADGNNQVNAIVSGNDVYNGTWAGNKYLNVFICGDIGGAAGYTQKPSSWTGTAMTNGIWILHNYVGSIGTGSTGTSRALTHEIGHWLNLDHTWGGNNNPGNATSCGTDDGVQDTPNCIGVTSCALNSNTCDTDDAYWGSPMKDNVENYMDYSYCSKMFTAGQVARMRAAIVSSVGGRSNVWSTANLTATGANGAPTLCKAQFKSNKTSVCIGDQIQFTDDSYNAVNGWTWSFPGGTPSTSTAQNPLITYSTPGIYQVTLTATDGTTSDSEVKTQYIRVLNPSSALPFHEGFESYSTLNNIPNWQVVDYNNNNDFELNTTTAHTGSKCVKLTNFGQVADGIDELYASPVNLSTINSATNVTLSFRYAHRKKASADYECLKVFVTSDCGDNWVQRKTMCGNVLSTLTETNAWTPASKADWVTVHMTNITSTYWVNDFRYMFKFESDNGNNIYIDDINIYAGPPSDQIVLGLEESTQNANLFELFPNPTEGEFQLNFNVATAQKASIVLTDVFGKIAQNHTIEAMPGMNQVFISGNDLAAGVYFVHFMINGQKSTKQVVIK